MNLYQWIPLKNYQRSIAWKKSKAQVEYWSNALIMLTINAFQVFWQLKKQIRESVNLNVSLV